MRKLLVLFAHPGQRYSHVNRLLAATARDVEGLSFVDLYAEYPRFKIDVDAEQERLLAHDAVIFQFPIYWYSTPSLLKEWQDLVLEYGFAYGPGGDRLAGKLFCPVVTTGADEDAYQTGGKNHFRLRSLLSPLEQTANLCQMHYLPPYALFSALSAAEDGRAQHHAQQYRVFLEALRDDSFDLSTAGELDLLSDTDLPLKPTAAAAQARS